MVMTLSLQHLATMAYHAYGAVTDFKNFRGEPMPEFDALPETIKQAWEAAVQAVSTQTSNGIKSDSTDMQSMYNRFCGNLLNYESIESAQTSIGQIDRLFNYFERLGDREGQHQVMVIALTGRNRAKWSGRPEEAKIFHEWLIRN